jgi:2'-5' RNA ligase
VGLAVGGRVAGEIDGLRRAVGARSLARIGPHLTLIPPLNVREESLGAVLALLRRCASFGPFEVKLGPARTFAPRNPVVYLEVGGEVEGIVALERALNVEPLTAPPGRPRRPYVPHVTIASGMVRAAVAPVVEAFSHFEVEASLELLVLYEQRNDERSHPWLPLADAYLGSATTSGRGGRQLDFVEARRIVPESVPWASGIPQSDDDSLVVSCSDGEEVVGFAFGERSGASYLITSLEVAPERRREGIGRLLVRRAEQAAARLGLGRLRVEAAKEAGGFFEAVGFSRGEDVLSRRAVFERLVSG